MIRYAPPTLWLVIERFKGGDYRAVGERFPARGRLMLSPPRRGVERVASWLRPSGAVCYQITRSPNRVSLEAWMTQGRDLVDFEVEASQHFWARASGAAR